MADRDFALGRHTIMYLLARGIPGLINFLAISIYTRLILPAEYGMYAMALASVFLANALIFQWVKASLIRFYLEYENQQGAFLSTVLLCFCILVVVTGIPAVAGLILFVGDSALRIVWSLCIMLTVANAWYELNLELIRAKLTPKGYGYLTMLKVLFSVGMGSILALFGGGAPGLLVGTLLGTMLAWGIAAGREWRGVSLHLFDYQLCIKMLQYGFPVAITSGMGFFIFSIDRFLLGWLNGVEAAGLYSVTYDLAQQSITLLMMIVNLAAYPLVLKDMESGGLERASERLNKNAVALLLIGIPALVGMSILAPNITMVVLGSAFRKAAPRIIPLIAAAGFILGVKNYYVDFPFYIGKRTLLQVWPVAVGAIISLGLNLIWIPKWGIHGAAYATVAAYSASLLLSWQLGRKVLRLPFPRMEFIRIIVAASLMAVVLWPIRLHTGLAALVFQLAIGTLTYAIGIIAMNTLGVREKIKVVLGRIVEKSIHKGVAQVFAGTIAVLGTGLLGAYRGTEASGLIFALLLGLFAGVVIACFVEDRTLRTILLLCLMVRMSLAFTHTYLFPLPDSSLDAVDFEETGWQAARYLLGVTAELPEISGANLYSLFIGICYFLFDRVPIIPQMGNVLAGVINVYLISQITFRVTECKKCTNFAAIIGVLVPTFNLYSAILLRENFTVLFTAASVYFFLLSQNNFRLRHVIISLAFLLIAAALHGGIIVIGCAYFMVVVFRNYGTQADGKKTAFSRIVLSIAIITLMVIFVQTGLLNKLPADLSALINSDYLESKVELAARSRAAYLVGYTPTGLPDLLLQTPVRILHFWFTPFPWMVSGLRDAIGFFDAMLYITLFILAIKGYKYIPAQNKPRFNFLVLTLLIFSVAFAWGTSNYGTAIRHRQKMLSIIIPIASSVYVSAKQNSPACEEPVSC